MASTPSNRLKLTPSNSPYIRRISRSPIRARVLHESSPSLSSSSHLSLTRVVGSTCCAPTGFDTVFSCFAYIAGGAVVVVDVHGNSYRQRFFRARPTAVPVYSVSPVPHAPSTPLSTPKANDSRNRAAASSHRDSTFGLGDWGDSPTAGKTWTQRERIKSATCLSLSRDGRFLAVGETGYAPRVLIFSLDDASSDTPLVSVREHSFGVTAVAWSADSRYLASLGTANDGFLYLWRIDARTGAAKLYQQNRCTSYVRGMLWLGNSTLVTFGVRHIKVWRVDDGAGSSSSPTKPSRYTLDGCFPSPTAQQQQQQQQQQNASQHRTLAGRNILLGALLEATFTCAVALSGGRAVVCSEAGDVCLLESTGAGGRQMKLVRLRNAGFSLSCIGVRGKRVYLGGPSGQSTVVDLGDLLESESRREGRRGSVDTASGPASGPASPTRSSSSRFSSLSSLPSPATRAGLVAMGFLTNHVVTVDTRRSIDIFSSIEHIPGTDAGPDVTRLPIPGHGEAILGVQALSQPNEADAAFFTWSASGTVLLWGLEGAIKASFAVPVEQQAAGESELDVVNQLAVVRATQGGRLFVTADRLGVLRVLDFATRQYVLETKAHASECQSIAVHEDGRRLLVATSGRDRTAQLFCRRSECGAEGTDRPDGTDRADSGAVTHVQTLEFAAKVVQVLFTDDDKMVTCAFDRTMQVHDLVVREGGAADEVAALPARVITLKASPSSMALGPGDRTVFVALLDRTVCQYELATGRLLTQFKCIDEGGAETALLDSLIYGTQGGTQGGAGSGASGPPTPSDASFLLGLSNTDKSVRIYDAQTGLFLDREWGHTEAINGVALMEEVKGPKEAGTSHPDSPADTHSDSRKVVSVGSDGTIMIWSLDLQEPTRAGLSPSRDPSPAKDSPVVLARPPLRRVLSKAELAEFQRGGSSGSGGSGSSTNGSGTNGRRSPRSLSRKTSRFHLTSGPARTPLSVLLNSPASTITEDARSRRASAGSGSGSPPMPVSPKAKVRRRPSLPALSSGGSGTGRAAEGAVVRKKTSTSSLRNAPGFGSLALATEQTCRQLRTVRKRLASTEPLAPDALVALDEELRLTAAALGERALRSTALRTELDGLLDERLDERLDKRLEAKLGRLVTLLDEKWRLRDAAVPDSGQTKQAGKRAEPPRRHERDGSAVSVASAASAASVASVASEVSAVSEVSEASTSNASDDRTTTGGDDQSSNSADTDNTLPEAVKRDVERPGAGGG